MHIRLNSKGTPVTCAEHEKTLFEYSKAKNILDSLPKTLSRLNFEVEPVSDLILEKDKKSEKNFIINNNYFINDKIEQLI